MSKTLAQQAIEQSIIEDAEERARRGGSRTLAEHALDQEARALKEKRQKPDKCARCGHPHSEHHYNGACYGLCGRFVRDLSGMCPEPVVPGWTMEECWRAKKCSCALGAGMGYEPITMPCDETGRR